MRRSVFLSLNYLTFSRFETPNIFSLFFDIFLIIFKNNCKKKKMRPSVFLFFLIFEIIFENNKTKSKKKRNETFRFFIYFSFFNYLTFCRFETPNIFIFCIVFILKKNNIFSKIIQKIKINKKTEGLISYFF